MPVSGFRPRITVLELTMTGPKSGSGISEFTDAAAPRRDLDALWARASDHHTRPYRFCGRNLRLRCDDAAYAHRFEGAFREFRWQASDPGPSASELTFLTRRTGPDGFPALIDRRNERLRVFACEEVYPTQLFACLAFVERRMFPLQDHFILHGAAVEHQGAVTALVGRTHSGKSTLGLRLAFEPDFSLLSDEFSPVRLADGVVEPFPRSLGLRQHARTFLVLHGAINDDLVARADAEIDVDPHHVRGLRIGSGGPLRNIVILSGEGVSTLQGERRLLALPFVSPSVLADLRAIPGVRSARPEERAAGLGTMVEIEVEKGMHVAKDLIRVCRDEHKMERVSFLPPHASEPDFTRPPVLTSVAPLCGIIETLRHLMNYLALESRFGSGYPRMLDCLAVRLGAVRFFSLRPGPLDDTTQLLRKTVFEA